MRSIFCFLFIFATFLLTQTHAEADFDWGSWCDGGNGSFSIQTEQQVVVVGEIPPGISGVEIYLVSTNDLDIQLYDKETNTEIIAWPSGILNGHGRQSADYQGVTIEYSGYNGDQMLTGRGNEYIKIPDTTNRPLIMKAFGYTAGSAVVNYTWTGCEGTIRIAELEALLAQVTAERDARPTLAEVQDARIGSVVLIKNEAGEINFDFKLEETEDLANWTPVAGGTWTNPGDGGVEVDLPLAPDKRFYRVVIKFEFE